MSTVTEATSRPITMRERFAAWSEIMQTAQPPFERPLDTVGKWLVMTRAAVLPMTLWSGTIGALLAAEASARTGADTLAIDWLSVVLAVFALVIAHAANNLINDYFDMSAGIDTDDYFRALYAPHPVLAGWISRSALRNAILALTAIDGLIMLVLAYWHGPLVVAFALAGLFLSVFYVAPPLSLKRRGLGELDVFLTWGPLMIGGTYLVAAGEVPLWVIAFSVPYALLVTSVLFGKHIDKLLPDARLGIRTLPVILGERLARRTNQALMILFYPLLLAVVLVGWVGPWVLLSVLALRELYRAVRIHSAPRPDGPPAWYPPRAWPLWFVAFAFRHVRLAGFLMTVGLVLNVVVPVRLPWL